MLLVITAVSGIEKTLAGFVICVPGKALPWSGYVPHSRCCACIVHAYAVIRSDRAVGMTKNTPGKENHASHKRKPNINSWGELKDVAENPGPGVRRHGFVARSGVCRPSRDRERLRARVAYAATLALPLRCSPRC